MKFKLAVVAAVLFLSGMANAYEGVRGSFQGKSIDYSTAITGNVDWALISTGTNNGGMILTYLQISSPGSSSQIYFTESKSTWAHGNYNPDNDVSTFPFAGGLATNQFTNGDGIWLGYMVTKSTGQAFRFKTDGSVP